MGIPQGPSPIELVCERLLGFISHPKIYPAYQDLDNEWRDKSVYRALELFLRLVRGTHAYNSLGQLALAGSGDSVRRALGTVRFFFESNELSFDYSLSSDAKKAIATLSLELQTISCISSVGLALREELVGFAMECDCNNITDSFVLKGAVRLAITVKNTILSSYQNTTGYQEQRLISLFQHEKVCKLCEEDIEAAAKLLRFRLKSCGIRDEVVEKYLMDFAHKFASDLTTYFTQEGKQTEGIVKFILTIKTWLSVVPSDNEEMVHGSDDLIEFPLVGDRLRYCKNILAPNKSRQLAKSLVRNKFLHNLFEDSKGNLTNVTLTLLYYIAKQEVGEVSFQVVLTCLLLRIDKKEILWLINELVHQDKRILWVNGRFSFQNFEELESLANSSDEKIRLTHGGWAYYFGVMDEFDYLLEILAMRNIGQGQHELLSARITNMLGHYKTLLEIVHVPANSDSDDENQWDSIERIATFDAFVRFTPGFAAAARGQFLKMQQIATKLPPEVRAQESEDIRNVVINWYKILRKYHPQIFSEESFSFEENRRIMPLARTGGFRRLAPMVGDLEVRYNSAILSLENLLKGDVIWTPGFPQDDFRTISQ